MAALPNIAAAVACCSGGEEGGHCSTVPVAVFGQRSLRIVELEEKPQPRCRVFTEQRVLSMYWVDERVCDVQTQSENKLQLGQTSGLYIYI